MAFFAIYLVIAEPNVGDFWQLQLRNATGKCYVGQTCSRKTNETLGTQTATQRRERIAFCGHSSLTSFRRSGSGERS